MAHYNFREDLRDGKSGERVIQHFLETQLNFLFLGSCDDYRYDLLHLHDRSKLPIKIEVKTDSWEKDFNDCTGNLVLEVEDRGRPSGITTSEADYYVWYMPFLDREQVWIAPSGFLKAGVALKRWPLKPIGEYSEKLGDKSGMAYLIPRHKEMNCFVVWHTDGVGNWWPENKQFWPDT